MSEFAARIGRIKLKGGADLHILPTRILAPDEEDWRAKVVEHARAIAETATDAAPLVGYFVIGFYADGDHNCGFRTDDDRNPIPRSLMPAYVEELVRRYAVTKYQAGETYEEIWS